MQQLDLIAKPQRPTRRERMAHARARGEYGMERVERSAENAHDGWCEQAVEALRRFTTGQAGMWTIELARLVVARDLPPPPDLRAWGVVTRLALRRGIIERVPGVYFAAASSNGSEKPCYRKGAKA